MKSYEDGLRESCPALFNEMDMPGTVDKDSLATDVMSMLDQLEDGLRKGEDPEGILTLVGAIKRQMEGLVPSHGRTP